MFGRRWVCCQGDYCKCATCSWVTDCWVNACGYGVEVCKDECVFVWVMKEEKETWGCGYENNFLFLGVCQQKSHSPYTTVCVLLVFVGMFVRTMCVYATLCDMSVRLFLCHADSALCLSSANREWTCCPLGERSDRPGGGAGREDQRPRKFSGGTPAETGLHRGNAAAGNAHTHTFENNICDTSL